MSKSVCFTVFLGPHPLIKGVWLVRGVISKNCSMSLAAESWTPCQVLTEEVTRKRQQHAVFSAGQFLQKTSEREGPPSIPAKRIEQIAPRGPMPKQPHRQMPNPSGEGRASGVNPFSNANTHHLYRLRGHSKQTSLCICQWQILFLASIQRHHATTLLPTMASIVAGLTEQTYLPKTRLKN